QPGSRVYERSWIRDGVLTAGALLRLGHAQEVREFLEWYAKFQFPNGKIPCVVDRRGAASCDPAGGTKGDKDRSGLEQVVP
ncbi:MAG: hypothetical protein AABZ02_12060, partial [Bacteroidota bacterium]